LEHVAAARPKRGRLDAKCVRRSSRLKRKAHHQERRNKIV
jgi:hypothetical protein